MLDDKTKTRIAKDAAERYPPERFSTDWLRQRESDRQLAYIAGAEAEAERSRGLVEALEYFIKDVKNKPNDTRYETALKQATEAIDNYHSTKVK